MYESPEKILNTETAMLKVLSDVLLFNCSRHSEASLLDLSAAGLVVMYFRPL